MVKRGYGLSTYPPFLIQEMHQRGIEKLEFDPLKD
jgi:hypothetical protein